MRIERLAAAMVAVTVTFIVSGVCTLAQADETCLSPYMAKIVGQEDYIYVWTLGMEGQGHKLLVRRWAQRSAPFGVNG
jgi:selenium-binding protein 1